EYRAELEQVGDLFVLTTCPRQAIRIRRPARLRDQDGLVADAIAQRRHVSVGNRLDRAGGEERIECESEHIDLRQVVRFECVPARSTEIRECAATGEILIVEDDADPRLW